MEGACGRGRHLAQWLVTRDEVVLDVPGTVTARIRDLSRGSRRKTDVIDAAAAASVAALQGDASIVAGEDHTRVFAADRVVRIVRGARSIRPVSAALR